jgi:NADH:ubiquinone oxidoreductase subunit K
MDGQIISIFIMAIAAAEAAVGLAIVTMLFRRTGHVDMDYFNILKG